MNFINSYKNYENRKDKNILPDIIKNYPGSTKNKKNISIKYENFKILNLNSNTFLGYTPASPNQTVFNPVKSIKNKSKNFLNTCSILMMEDENKIENDLKKLHQSYFNADCHLKTNKSVEKEIFTKFNIDNSVSRDEINDIYSALKSSYNSNKNPMNNSTTVNNTILNTIGSTNSKIYKAHINICNGHYEDPINAMKKLKINKQIHDNMVNIITKKQIQKYNEKYEENLDYYNKLDKVRNPKITIHRIDSYLNNRIIEKDEESSDKAGIELSNKNDKIKIKINKNFSRDDFIKLKEFHGSYSTFSKYRPSCRSQATLTITRNGAYLIGGINTDRLIDFWKLDIIEPNIFQWSEVKVLGDMPLPRMGHSAVYYKHQIFIFGGNIEIDAKMPKDDITIFNIEGNNVQIANCLNKKDLRWRRNHIAEIVGSQMIIHGGIDEYGEYLSDCFLLDLDYLRWREVFPKEMNYKPLPIAYHSSACVISSDKQFISNLNIFKFPDIPKLSLSKIKQEGIYIFGGIDKDGNSNNELKIIKIGKKPLEWFSPAISGQVPSPRHSSSITFISNLEIIILHGGRNDNIMPNTFNDVYILNLLNFEWINVKIFDHYPKNRSDHCSLAFNNKLIIFGGTDTENYVGSEIFLMDLDYFENKKKKNDCIFNKISISENISSYGRTKINESKNNLNYILENVHHHSSYVNTNSNIEVSSLKNPNLKTNLEVRNSSTFKKLNIDLTVLAKEDQLINIDNSIKNNNEFKSLLSNKNLASIIKKGSVLSSLSYNLLDENKNLITQELV